MRWPEEGGVLIQRTRTQLTADVTSTEGRSDTGTFQLLERQEGGDRGLGADITKEKLR